MKSLTSQIQSRLAKRANYITQQTQWKIYHRKLEQMNDWRITKETLKNLNKDQTLDKELLKMAYEVPKMQADIDTLIEIVREFDNESR